MTSKAIICYHNLAAKAATVVASSSRTGFSALNASNWRTTIYWSPTAASGTHTLTYTFASAVSADSFAFYRHNLATCGATIKLQYSTNSGSTWSDCFSALSPADNDCVIKTFTQVSATYWRIVVVTTNANPFYLGIAIFGLLLRTYRGMPEGFVIPRQARKNQILNNQTDGGQFGGKSILSHGAATRIEFRHVPRGWVRSTWEPFVLHAERYAFFFSWNHDDHPDDAVFSWVAEGDMPELPTDAEFYQQVNLPVKCLLSGNF